MDLDGRDLFSIFLDCGFILNLIQRKDENEIKCLMHTKLASLLYSP